MRASKACQTNMMRVLRLDVGGKHRKEMAYAVPRMASVDRSESTVVLSISSVRGCDVMMMVARTSTSG